MSKIIKYFSKHGVRIVALTLCLCMVSLYFVSETFAVYRHQITATDNATVANLGSVTITTNAAVVSGNITPGYDFKRLLTVQKNAAASNNASSYIILAIKKGCYEFEQAPASHTNNCFFLSGKFPDPTVDSNSNPHKDQTASFSAERAIHFHISSDWTYVSTTSADAGDYIYFYRKSAYNSSGESYNILAPDSNGNTVFVDPLINTDDIKYIDNKVTSNPFNVSAYLVSSYGYNNDAAEIKQLCKDLYDNVINK